jgi:HTH-type transcriptional regulator/antitoxin HigA
MTLNRIIDIVGKNENHPLKPLLDFVGYVISNYEKHNHTPPDALPVQVLAFLMQQHGLTQSQLPEIGYQSFVSDILSGKRELNLKQIMRLSKRFNVSPLVFMNKQ